MARKYKVHKFYAVIWHNQFSKKWFRNDMLTKREARSVADYVMSYPDNDYVEVVRRVIATDKAKGDIDLEAL